MLHPIRATAFSCVALTLFLSASGAPRAGPASSPGAGPASTPGDASRGYQLARCDGGPVARDVGHAALGAPPAAYVGSVGSVGAGDNGLFAIDPAGGAVRWCVRFALAGPRGCPALGRCPPSLLPAVGTPLADGAVAYVCVSGPTGMTYAFDAADGALRWARATGCGSTSNPLDFGRPILADGVLYSGAYGLDPADGAVRWRLPPGGRDGPRWIVATVARGVAYVYAEHTVRAIGLADGAARWAREVDAPIGARPALVGDTLYVGDIAGDSPPAVARGLPDTYALDARTGAIRWRAATGIVAGSSAVAAGGLVFIGGDNALRALDAATGAVRWSVWAPYDGYVASTPVVAGGLVYFAADGAYAVDAATGAVRWHAALGWDPSVAFTAPALVGDALILGRADGGGHGTLVALDAATGAARWQRAGFNQLVPPGVA